MCFLAREPWIKLPVYALAQTLGSFLGAGIVFGLYYGKWARCSAWLLAALEFPLGWLSLSQGNFEIKPPLISQDP